MTLRLAFQGTGKIARGCLVPASLADRVSIAGVASRDAGRARAFIDEYGEHTAPDCRAMAYGELADASDIDAVYITLPNNLHVGWSLLLLEAGKHVLCEKPATPHPAEMERVLSSARAHELVWQEAFMYPHHPQTDALVEITRRAIHDPEASPIGRLHSIRASAMVDLGDGPHVEHRLRHSTQGGAIADVGVYPLGICRYLTGLEPDLDTIKANARPAAVFEGEGHPVDAGAFVSFVIPAPSPGGGTNPVLCHCATSLDAWGGHDLHLIGTKAMLRTGFPFWPSADRATLEIVRWHDVVDTITIEDGGDRITRQFANFARSCLDGEPITPSQEWSMGMTRVLDRIYGQLPWPRLPPSPSISLDRG